VNFQQLSSVSVRKKTFNQLSDSRLIKEGRVLTELHITINTRSRNMSAEKAVVFTQLLFEQNALVFIKSTRYYNL
jgi:hypothetical protein